MSSLTALALTAGLLSQAHAVQVPGKENSCSAVWDTGTATATVSTTGVGWETSETSMQGYGGQHSPCVRDDQF
jgi:hypothetical protein